MPFHSPGHPGGHPDNAFDPPGHAGPAPYQPYYGPGGNVWTSERPFALEQAEAQMLDMVAREEEMKDQEKRLFLEEYRYVGRQTVCSFHFHGLLLSYAIILLTGMVV